MAEWSKARDCYTWLLGVNQVSRLFGGVSSSLTGVDISFWPSQEAMLSHLQRGRHPRLTIGSSLPWLLQKYPPTWCYCPAPLKGPWQLAVKSCLNTHYQQPYVGTMYIWWWKWILVDVFLYVYLFTSDKFQFVRLMDQHIWVDAKMRYIIREYRYREPCESCTHTSHKIPGFRIPGRKQEKNGPAQIGLKRGRKRKGIERKRREEKARAGVLHIAWVLTGSRIGTTAGTTAVFTVRCCRLQHDLLSNGDDPFML